MTGRKSNLQFPQGLSEPPLKPLGVPGTPMGPAYTPLALDISLGTPLTAHIPQESKTNHNTSTKLPPSDPAASLYTHLNTPGMFWLSLIYSIVHLSLLYLTPTNPPSWVLHIKIPDLLWVGTIQVSDPRVWDFYYIQQTLVNTSRVGKGINFQGLIEKLQCLPLLTMNHSGWSWKTKKTVSGIDIYIYPLKGGHSI